MNRGEMVDIGVVMTSLTLDVITEYGKSAVAAATVSRPQPLNTVPSVWRVLEDNGSRRFRLRLNRGDEGRLQGESADESYQPHLSIDSCGSFGLVEPRHENFLRSQGRKT